MTTHFQRLAPRYPIPELDYPEAAVAQRWLQALAWRATTIADVLEQTVDRRGSATALVDDNERLTYRELDARSAAAARRLLGLGLNPGDRVLVQVGTGIPAVVALLGLFRAALVPVCTVPRYRRYEMTALADLSGARAHLIEIGAAGTTDLLDLAKELRDRHPNLQWTIVAGEEQASEAFALEPPDSSADDGQTLRFAGASPLDVAAFQLSGGTTGVPKIIPRFHGEYIGYADAWANRVNLTSADVVLWALPITHNAGMLCFLIPTLLRGATLVLRSRFEAESFLRTIEDEQVTLTGSIGPIAARLLDYDGADIAFDLSSVRLFLTLHRAAEIEAHLGVPALGIYGITEGLLMASSPSAPTDARHLTVGYPVAEHDELALLSPEEEVPVAEGQVGELCFRGPSTLHSYYGNSDGGQEAFTSEGFFRTGDLVRAHTFEGQRYLSFEGRIKDNIDRGGEKFGTEEIELLLATHPAILSAVIVGMPDRYLGERVCAFVIPRRSRAIPSVAEMATYLLERGLAKFKCPERIEAVTELPATSVGKLDRPALRRTIADILAREQSS
jgi:pyochelin biosynthesis protein PchD